MKLFTSNFNLKAFKKIQFILLTSLLQVYKKVNRIQIIYLQLDKLSVQQK